MPHSQIQNEKKLQYNNNNTQRKMRMHRRPYLKDNRKVGCLWPVLNMYFLSLCRCSKGLFMQLDVVNGTLSVLYFFVVTWRFRIF